MSNTFSRWIGLSPLDMAELRFLASEARVTRYVGLIEKIKISGGDTSSAEGMLKIFQSAAYLMAQCLVKEQERSRDKTMAHG